MKSHEIKTFRKTYKDYTKECAFEGYQLAVLFDEKDDVKQLGGRWDKDDKTWWMPKEKLDKNFDCNGAGVGTIREHLNNHQMIMGQYGEHDSTIVLSDMTAHRRYKLVQDNVEIIVHWYDDYDAVKFETVVGNFGGRKAHHNSKWFKIADARTNWNSLIDEGYNNTKIENNS
jgi:hypothetical protein